MIAQPQRQREKEGANSLRLVVVVAARESTNWRQRRLWRPIQHPSSPTLDSETQRQLLHYIHTGCVERACAAVCVKHLDPAVRGDTSRLICRRLHSNSHNACHAATVAMACSRLGRQFNGRPIFCFLPSKSTCNTRASSSRCQSPTNRTMRQATAGGFTVHYLCTLTWHSARKTKTTIHILWHLSAQGRIPVSAASSSSQRALPVLTTDG